jgi:glycosyltransferase involved in cell wall biosynthesis
LKLLAIVPSPCCFGLQNLTLAFFGHMPGWVRPHFLTTRWTDGEFDRRLDALGIPHTSTWMGMFSRKLDWVNLRMTMHCLLKLPVAWLRFLRLYFSFRPDIVYLANYHEILLFWPLLFWIRRRIVCHMHDPPPAIPFQRSNFFIWRRAVGRFVFISNNVRERIAELGPLGSNNAVIHNGIVVQRLTFPRIRTERFSEMFAWPGNSLIFGITGQLAVNKGQMDFIEAAAIACRSHLGMRFVIGGRGPLEYLEQLKKLVAARGLEDHVGLSGWLPHVADFYEGIDVFVLASRHEEGFGLVLAEAGERGLPAITTSSGGAVEVLQDGITGIIVDRQDPQALAQAMVRLGADVALRQRMGQRAREHIVEEFDVNTQAKRLAEFLCESTLPA